MIYIRVSALMFVLCSFMAYIAALPDGGDYVPLPGPGLVHGGIPYGSVSGNVAEFALRSLPSIGRYSQLTNQNGNSIDYAPIEQYL